MEPFYPLRALVCARVLPRAARGVRDAASRSSPRLRVLLVVLDELARARPPLRRGDDRALRPRRGAARSSRSRRNDGYLLQYFVERGIPVLGIEPAANVAEVGDREGHPDARSQFFGARPRRDLRAASTRPTCCSRNNVLAHVPDLNDFVAGMKVLLAPGGVHHDRVPAPAAADRRRPVRHDLPRALLVLLVPHRRACSRRTGCGSSTSRSCRRTAARCASTAATPTTPASRDRRARASCASASAPRATSSSTTYPAFAERVTQDKRQILALPDRAQGARACAIAGYGAPAKGNTLLNYCGIGRDFLDYTVDLNPHKQGHFLPGTPHPDPLAREHRDGRSPTSSDPAVEPPRRDHGAARVHPRLGRALRRAFPRDPGVPVNRQCSLKPRTTGRRPSRSGAPAHRRRWLPPAPTA